MGSSPPLWRPLIAIFTSDGTGEVFEKNPLTGLRELSQAQGRVKGGTGTVPSLVVIEIFQSSQELNVLPDESGNMHCGSYHSLIAVQFVVLKATILKKIPLSRPFQSLKKSLPVQTCHQYPLQAGGCTGLNRHPCRRDGTCLCNKRNNCPVCLPVNRRSGDTAPDGLSPFVVAGRKGTGLCTGSNFDGDKNAPPVFQKSVSDTWHESTVHKKCSPALTHMDHQWHAAVLHLCLNPAGHACRASGLSHGSLPDACQSITRGPMDALYRQYSFLFCAI